MHYIYTYILSSMIVTASPPYLLPIGAPTDAYDSIKYGSLIRLAICPNSLGQCTYPATPDDGPIQWSCTAGNFCPGPMQSIPCTFGFYCPINASQPIRCPARHYCSKDTSTLTVCPENFICPIGTINPIPCAFLSYCPAGSDSQPTYGIAIVLMIILCIILLLFQIKYRVDQWMNQKMKIKMDGLVSSTPGNDPILTKLQKTFDIDFEDIGWTLDSQSIMDGVSGSLKSGRMCAIMGPSGSGKTTFVNLLTGKVTRSSGIVKINGQADELFRYKKLIGFVPQDDIMLRELTVMEILMHSARMRLPREWNYDQIRTKVLCIMASLGISHVAYSIVGNEEERGISGGQRKRVNIGMELVAEPSIMFLDEPTSGLDSSTAFELCKNLRKITQEQQLTVAAVIHSPSPATFKQFDDLMLLGKGGRIVYFGSIMDAPCYFEKIGFPCPADESLADFVMNIVNGKVENATPVASLFELWNNHLYGKSQFKELNLELTSSHFPTKYSISSRIIGLRNWVRDLMYDYRNSLLGMYRSVSSTPDPIRDTCPFHVQTFYLLRRACRQNFNKPLTVVIDVILHYGIGAFIGIAINSYSYLGQFPNEVCISQAFNLQKSCLAPEDGMIIVAVYICMGVYFAGMSAGTATFGREKVVYWRDSASGMYTVPYYIAKVCADIPRIIIAGIMSSLAISYMFTIVGSFSKLLLLLEVLYISTFSLGYFVSVIFPQGQTPLICAGFALLFALVLSGATPSLNDVYKGAMLSKISFIWDTSAARWATEALWVEEVYASSFAGNAPLMNPYKWDNFYPALAYILLIAFGWNVATFFCLKLSNRSKQK